jgi:hypothetical protein
LTVEELRRELARSLRMTAESLVRLALIVRSLETRGEDLSELKIGLLPYLRQIAYGQVLPEVVVRYAERPMLVRSIAALPWPDQERLSNGAKVALAVRCPDGTLDHRMVDPLYMDRAQVQQVFARGRIRPPEEQLVALEANRTPRAKAPAAEAIDDIRIDRGRNGLIVGRKFVPLATIVEALALLRDRDGSGADIDEESSEYTTLSIRVDAVQHERIRRAAYEGNTKVATLVRRALVAYGLI